MVSRSYALAGPLAASIFAVLTAYTAFQPELVAYAAERSGQPIERPLNGTTAAEPNEKDSVISRAIMSDFKQAAEELKAPAKRGGFAWALREKIWGAGGNKSGDEVKLGKAETEIVRQPEK